MNYVLCDGRISNSTCSDSLGEEVILFATFDGGSQGQTTYVEESDYSAVATFKGNSFLTTEELVGNQTSSLFVDRDSSDEVTFAPDPRFDLNSNTNFEITGRFRQINQLASAHRIYSQQILAGGDGFFLETNNGAIRFTNREGGVNYRVIGQTPLSLNIDYSFRVSKQGDTISLFLNDNLEGSFTRTWIFAPFAAPTVGNRFDGYLAAIKVVRLDL